MGKQYRGLLNSTSFRNELPKCTLRGSRLLDVNGSLPTRELSLQLAGLRALKTVEIPARFLPKFFFASQILDAELAGTARFHLKLLIEI